jgi:hypothetical protein
MSILILHVSRLTRAYLRHIFAHQWLLQIDSIRKVRSGSSHDRDQCSFKAGC